MDATRELETEDARRKNESVELLKFLRQTEHAGDAIRCPICNTSGKFRTTLVMFVSEKCGHEMCDSCLSRRYESRATAPCQSAACEHKLRRTDFREKRFLNGKMHLEMAVREELAKVYCMALKDFDDEAKHDAYLEEVEGIVYDRVHGDAETASAAREKVEQYRKKYANVIEERQRQAKYDRKRKRDDIKDEMKATEAKRHEHNMQRAKDRAETKREKDRLKAQLLRTTNRDELKRILEDLRALKNRKLQQQMEGPPPDVIDEVDSDDESELVAAAAAAAAATAAVTAEFPMYIYEAVVVARPRGGPLAPPTPMLAPRLAVLPQCIANDATAIPYVGATGHRPKDIAKRALEDAFSCLFC